MPTTRIVIEKGVSPLVFSEETTRRIATGWAALQSRDPRVYNGTLLRTLHAVSTDTTSVSVAPDIGYREVVGLRSYRDFLDWTSAEEQFQVLSAIAFVETTDGKVLLKDRSTGDWGHSMELLGGFFTAQDVFGTVEEYIRARVAAELSLPLETVSHVDFMSTCESMFVFKVSLTIPFNDLIQTPMRFSAIPEGYTPSKHQSFFSIPLHSPSQTVLERFLPAVIG